MSVFWLNDNFGYDGDEFHGHVRVNYWQGREAIEAELEIQMDEIRKGVRQEYDRLTIPEDDSGAER